MTEKERLFGGEEEVPGHGRGRGGVFAPVGDELGGAVHRVGDPADEVGAAAAGGVALAGDQGGEGDGVQGGGVGGRGLEPGRGEPVPAGRGPVADGDEQGGAGGGRGMRSRVPTGPSGRPIPVSRTQHRSRFSTAAASAATAGSGWSRRSGNAAGSGPRGPAPPTRALPVPSFCRGTLAAAGSLRGAGVGAGPGVPEPEGQPPRSRRTRTPPPRRHRTNPGSPEAGRPWPELRRGHAGDRPVLGIPGRGQARHVLRRARRAGCLRGSPGSCGCPGPGADSVIGDRTPPSLPWREAASPGAVPGSASRADSGPGVKEPSSPAVECPLGETSAIGPWTAASAGVPASAARCAGSMPRAEGPESPSAKLAPGAA